MFIRTLSGSVVNSAHIFVLKISESQLGFHIDAVTAIASWDCPDDDDLYTEPIFVRNNKDEVKKALDSICEFIECGATLWDADVYERESHLYKPEKRK